MLIDDIGKAFSYGWMIKNGREDTGTGMIIGRAFRVAVRHSSAIIF
jgi:hypothetical protein